MNDDFTNQTSKKQEQIAPHPFLAALPQKLLQRGALAVMGPRGSRLDLFIPVGKCHGITDPAFRIRFAAA